MGGEEMRRRPWVSGQLWDATTRSCIKLMGVDSSCKQRACGFGLTPDVGTAERLLGQATCLDETHEATPAV
jgi:hypothetical protein